MRVYILAVYLLFIQTFTAFAQVYPPGTFAIDGTPIVCGQVTFILDPNLSDIGIADGQGRIFLNSTVLPQLPTPLKLYWAAHECGHYFVGANETAADCWAIKTGRNQGWFSPQDFQKLEQMFSNNPGDMAHPSGPQRVAAMVHCYNTIP